MCHPKVVSNGANSHSNASSTATEPSTMPPLREDPSKFSDLEKKRLIEFRARVSDILTTEEHQLDGYLVRWLRARNLHVGKAEEMLRASMKWRKENNVDTIKDRITVPDELKAVAPMAYLGFSKDGYPAFLVPFGRHDVRAAVEKYGPEFMGQVNIANMEMMGKMIYEDGKKLGIYCPEIVEIFDCEGYSYRQMASKVCRDLMTDMQKVFDANYPEVMHCVVGVNVPKIFTVVFNMFKPFIPKRTLEKIELYGTDPNVWMPIIRAKFPIDRVPPHWGGTLEGVDEYCSGHEIWMQGPKDLRPFMHGLAEADSDFEKVSIAARGKFTKEIEVPQKGTILQWKFKTDNYDIAFQVTYAPFNSVENGNGNKSKNQDETRTIIPNVRVDSHSAVQEDSHTCESQGLYTFTFDNSYSLLKGKTLLYQIDAVDPEQQDYFEDCPEI